MQNVTCSIEIGKHQLMMTEYERQKEQTEHDVEMRVASVGSVADDDDDDDKTGGSESGAPTDRVSIDSPEEEECALPEGALSSDMEELQNRIEESHSQIRRHKKVISANAELKKRLKVELEQNEKEMDRIK